MAIRYPLKRYQGPFEKYVLVTGGRGASKFVSQCLESFFGHWPTVLGLEQFTVIDIHEYCQWRLANGANQGRVTAEIRQVSRFYQWCIRNKNCRLYDPCKPWLEGREVKHRPLHSVLTVKEFIRLMEVSSVPLRRYLVAIVAGEKCRHILDPMTASVLLKRAKVRAGVEWLTFERLRYSLKKGLWSEIIRRHCDLWLKEYSHAEVRDTPTDEPKLLSTPAADIEITTVNERTPVINHSDDCFSVGWVGDFEDSSESEIRAGHSHEAPVEHSSVSC